MKPRKNFRLSYTLLLPDGKHRKVVTFYKEDTCYLVINQLQKHTNAYDFKIERI